MSESTEAVSPAEGEAIRNWTGHRLDDMAGGNVGRVEGCFVAESSGRAEWVVARMGRFGHYTLIPARDAVEGVGHVWVPYTRDQIRAAPRVDPNAPLTAGTERELLAHYGIAVDAGRMAELTELGEGAVSARPA
jgi:hypothetical protein